MKRTPLRRKSALRPKRVHRRGLPKPKSPVQELDALLRQVVLARDGFRCQWCERNARPGRGGGLEVAHVLPKGAYPALRHDLENVVLLCHRCHHYRWHRNPVAAWEWITELRGEEWLRRLRLWARTRHHVDRGAVRLYLEAELEKLNAGKIPGR